ncbi:hypothetical protein LCGC14_0850750, partial [marine sediment metagenome]
MKTKLGILLLFLGIQMSFAQVKSVDVDAFDKVIVSPHIQV